MDSRESLNLPEESPTWISKALFDETVRVWKPRYESTGRKLSEYDVIEILTNMRGFFQELQAIDQNQQSVDRVTGKSANSIHLLADSDG